MTTREKFDAAVNVIKGLPKRGSYQPSNELMLRFYAFFKQATEGKCNISKPGFWDVIKRAKWEAWNKLGDMSPESAMEAYVEELHKIVETMAYTDNVAAFFETMDDDSDIPISKNDLYLVAGDVFRNSTSSPAPPTGTRNFVPTNGDYYPNCNGYVESEDEYIDTEEHEEIHHSRHNSYNMAIPNGHIAHTTSEQSSTGSTTLLESSNRILEELRRTIVSLEKDVSQLKTKLNHMDKEQRRLQNSLLLRRPSWWPFKNVSPALVVAVIVWPVIANRMISFIRKKK